jgi:branched-chain amino acid transport system substrate-binding protein
MPNEIGRAVALEDARAAAASSEGALTMRLALPLLAAAIASLLLAGAASAEEPIRLGYLTVKTGPLAAGGRQMDEGLALFLKERGSTLAGRKVELVVGDTAGQPAQARAKAQELVERDKAAVLIGPLATFEAIALDPYLRQVETPDITPTSSASVDLKARPSNPYLIHAVGTAAQPTHALGEYAAKTLGLKRVATIADDFTYGHEGVAGFQRVFEENGGKVVQKLWPPLNVPDYGSYIAQIKGDVDAVYIGFAGVNGLRFLKQYSEYGLKERIPVLGNTTSTDEGILKNMGDEALGVVTAGWYAAGIETADNRKFVAAMRESTGADPGFYAAGTYTAGLVLEAALQAIGGKIEDRKAFVEALHKVHIEHGPIAPIRLDEYGTPILPIHIRKVERREGRLVNAIVETIPEVSQFWRYDAAKFVAEPVYSRDWPAAKNLEP